MAQLRPETFVMLSPGLTGSNLSVVLILIFQAIHGYAHYMLGLLVSSFMIGMALGHILAIQELRLIAEKL